MTAKPRDSDISDIARLRARLAGVQCPIMGGENLSVTLASFFEPSIDDEELDESGTWKQGALDATEEVLDGVHAHYAAFLVTLSARLEALEAENAKLRKAQKPFAEAAETDYFAGLVAKARQAAEKAAARYPQPNYVALKIAEEAGEVVRGAVHYGEGRMVWEDVENEIVQLLAMLIRFVTEGDSVNGIIPPAPHAANAGHVADGHARFAQFVARWAGDRISDREFRSVVTNHPVVRAILRVDDPS